MHESIREGVDALVGECDERARFHLLIVSAFLTQFVGSLTIPVQFTRMRG